MLDTNMKKTRVDTFSHMGGLAAGVLLGFFLIPVSWWPNHHRSSKKHALFLYGVRVLGVCLFALFLGLLVHFFSIGKLDEVSSIRSTNKEDTLFT